MPQAGSCRICSHAAIESINRELVDVATSGKSLKAIAKQFGVSATTLGRHKKSCLPQSPQDPETERAASPQPRPGVTPELRERIIAANQAVQRSRNPQQTAVAMRLFAQAITDAITDNGAPQP